MMSTLFAEIVGWAVRNGAERIDQLGRPWEGETDEWRVRINATGQEVDCIPHMAAALEHKAYCCFCVVGPSGGAAIGANENDLIEHFRNASPTTSQ